MAAQLHPAFGDEVALLHSALTPDERAEQWHRIRRGEARIVVGHALGDLRAGAEPRPDHRR